MAVLATAVWRVRPSGSNTNGGGYDPGIAGAATDYSQQDAAQATGTVGTATGTATFTDAGGAFTAAMVGNALWIASGAGFTVGAYFITAFGSSTSVTLDRSPGTGTVAHWALGGGWADFWTNVNTNSPLVSLNTVFILGSGVPNPASYTYDYTVTVTVNNSNVVSFINDPGTPSYKAFPDTTGGMPVIKCNGTVKVFQTGTGSANVQLNGLWFVATTNTVTAGNIVVAGATVTYVLMGCVFDQFSFDACLTQTNSGGCSVELYGCEIFSSVAPGANGTHPAAQCFVGSLLIVGCNIHDTVGIGIKQDSTGSQCVVAVLDSIVAKCRADGIQLQVTLNTIVKSCTIDGNIGSGINISAAGVTPWARIFGNIISNHTQASTYGINNSSGGAGAVFIDFNTYYNNTTDLNNLSYGPHDTHGGSNPYVAQATENYTLA